MVYKLIWVGIILVPVAIAIVWAVALFEAISNAKTNAEVQADAMGASVILLWAGMVLGILAGITLSQHKRKRTKPISQ